MIGLREDDEMSNQTANHRAKLGRKARRAQVVALRKKGATLQAIADEMGFTKARASQIVRQEIEALAAVTEADARVLREMELQRLDAIQLRLWPTLEGDTEANRTSAAREILRCMERRAKLLGLDAPEPIHPDLPAPGGAPVLNVTIGGDRAERVVALGNLEESSFRARVPSPGSGSGPRTNGDNGGPPANGGSS